MDMDLDSIIRKYNERFGTHISRLKDLQLQAIQSVLHQDTVCMLPTGYGKSLVYEILPDFCMEVLHKKAFVVIIVPLNVIADQITNRLGLFAVSLTEGKLKELGEPNSALHTKLLSGEILFLVSHPENIVGKKVISALFAREYFHDLETFIVIDEAHCVLQWGEEFRPLFQQLGKLRAVLPSAKVLALSATLAIESRVDLAKILQLKNVKAIMSPPARENISLVVCKRPKSVPIYDSIQDITRPLITELLKEGDRFPVTVVYFSNQGWLGIAYETACRILGDGLYVGDRQLENARVVQYHASLDSNKNEAQVKSTILSCLRRGPQETPLRIVLATVALSMGIDLQSVQRVITIGPKTLEEYTQQVGRAGRAGAPARSVLYYNNTDLGQTTCSKSMKEFCRNRTVCRRHLLNTYFGFDSPEPVDNVAQTICCDVCSPETAALYQFPMQSAAATACSTLKMAICDYIQNDTTCYLAGKLDASVIEQILCCPSMFLEADSLTDHFQLSRDVAQSLASIISAVKEGNVPEYAK